MRTSPLYPDSPGVHVNDRHVTTAWGVDIYYMRMESLLFGPRSEQLGSLGFVTVVYHPKEQVLAFNTQEIDLAPYSKRLIDVVARALKALRDERVLMRWRLMEGVDLGPFCDKLSQELNRVDRRKEREQWKR